MAVQSGVERSLLLGGLQPCAPLHFGIRLGLLNARGGRLPLELRRRGLVFLVELWRWGFLRCRFLIGNRSRLGKPVAAHGAAPLGWSCCLLLGGPDFCCAYCQVADSLYYGYSFGH